MSAAINFSCNLHFLGGIMTQQEAATRLIMYITFANLHSPSVLAIVTEQCEQKLLQWNKHSIPDSSTSMELLMLKEIYDNDIPL